MNRSHDAHVISLTPNHHCLCIHIYIGSDMLHPSTLTHTLSQVVAYLCDREAQCRRRAGSGARARGSDRLAAAGAGALVG